MPSPAHIMLFALSSNLRLLESCGLLVNESVSHGLSATESTGMVSPAASLGGQLTVCEAARNRLNLGIPAHTHGISLDIDPPVPRIACPKGCESRLACLSHARVVVQRRKEPCLSILLLNTLRSSLVRSADYNGYILYRTRSTEYRIRLGFFPPLFSYFSCFFFFFFSFFFFFPFLGGAVCLS